MLTGGRSELDTQSDNLITNLRGRLRNTPLPLKHGLFPVFEAVVNSIHSIEEKGKELDSGRISVEIERHGQINLTSISQSEDFEQSSDNDITGFVVKDNGVGFNTDNYLSFKTLDSELKIDKGCRGVGRLLWLKVFKRAIVSSTYREENNTCARKFSFDAVNGIQELETNPDSLPIGENLYTTVHLQEFAEKYRRASSKTLDSIARQLLEHCLWYFVRDESVAQITVIDGDDYIDLNELYEKYMFSSATKEKILVKDREFDLVHVKFRKSSNRNHSIAYCAANRLVIEENISGKIPGLFGGISDADGIFTYSCYTTSKFLDERVRSERTSFDLEEKIDGIFHSTEISLSDIRTNILDKAQAHLKPHLDIKIKESHDRIDDYVSKKAPKYRPILGRLTEEQMGIDPHISDKELESKLHEYLGEIERELIDTGHDIMQPKPSESFKDYQDRLQEYLNTVEDIKKTDLASYVSHRKVVLDILRAAITKDESGNYTREEVIHQLIMPMGKTSNDIFSDSCNLWLIDERLSFHGFLASDKPISSMPVTSSTTTKEPDLLGVNVCDNPLLISEGQQLPLASIIVVEFKKPMRNDIRKGEKHDPIEQALVYLDKVRDGEVTTAKGRQIPESQNIPGFCYVVCDITKTVKKRCKILDLTPTSDHLGYFGFHKEFKAYIEVISFDRLLASASERNKAFFDKLGLPTN